MSTPTVTTQGTTAILTLSGRFTAESHAGFKAVAYPLFEEARVSTICIDLATVSYMDSSSLGTLLLLREKANAKGKKITLRNPNPTLLPILKMIRFDKLFETVTT
jgi:HptB-dependent secretion and biofilm anti anti-sigma factor